MIESDMYNLIYKDVSNESELVTKLVWIIIRLLAVLLKTTLLNYQIRYIITGKE